jgi:predicted amidohydrolase
VKVGALQVDLGTAAVGENLARIEAGLREAAGLGLALVALPEMWPTSFPPSGGPERELLARSEEALARVAELSRELGLVVVGSAWGGRERGPPANRLHVLDRGRRLPGYDKIHLFTPTAEREAFSAGEEPPPVVESSLGRLGGIVCYGLRFPEVARALFRGGAELVLVCAQWPRPRAGHWRALCVGRAVEAQAFVVAANRVGTAEIGRRRMRLEFAGGSLVVAPSGEVLAEGGPGPGTVLAEVDLALVREARREVPVARDERPDLYARWGRA